MFEFFKILNLLVILCQDRWRVLTNGQRLSGTQLESDFLSSHICMMIMTMLMMSTEHQQLLPGEIINNQSPISQAFKSIKHIMDTQAFGQGNDRNWV